MITENLPNIKVLALLLDPTIHTFFPHLLCIENTLEGLREVIGCKCVTCTEIEVAGKSFDVWSDDEALLNENPVPNLYLSDELILFGNLVIAKHDEEGEMLGLTFADFRLLKKYFGR